jgi:hypothetical protein
MKTIQVSEEVYSYLLSQTKDFGETPDKVLRRLLLDKKAAKQQPPLDDDAEHVLLWWKGVKFPEGMQLRAKAKPNITGIIKNGYIVVNGKPFGSPSAAAVFANGGTPTNGWIYWEFLDYRRQRWVLLDNLRVANSLSF